MSAGSIHQSRVALGLPAEPPGGEDLAQVPPDLDQTFSSIRQAQAELMRSASQLGVVPSSLSMSPKQMLEEFYKRDPEGNIDRIFAKLASDGARAQAGRGEASDRRARVG